MKATLALIILFCLSHFSIGQNNKYSLYHSSPVVIINEETLVGHFSEYDLKNFEFRQCNKQLFRRKSKTKKERFDQGIPLYEIKEHYEPIISGQFVDGKRAGYWTYWSRNYDPNSYCNLIMDKKTILYSNDSIYSFENHLFGKSEMIYNLDSSFFKGHYLLKDKFNIAINCNLKDSINCTFKNDSILIATSSIEKWQETLDHIEYKHLNAPFRRK